MRHQSGIMQPAVNDKHKPCRRLWRHIPTHCGTM